MTTAARMRRRIARAAPIVAGAAITGFVLAIAFDPFFVAGGSAPAIIWGPALGPVAVALGAGALLLVALWRQGHARWTALALWLIFLAAATHRLVEHGDGAVEDLWLGVALRALPADGADETPRCRVGAWRARCIDGAGRTLTSFAPIPFVPLHPGRWADRR
ncbi:MAG: hypothetical protein ABW173_08475 [Sphingomonas sp.]